VRRFSRIAVVGVAVALPLTASAMLHLKLARSEPAANATVPAAPTVIKLWFSQPPQLAVTRVSLVHGGDAPVSLAPVTRAQGADAPVVAPVPAGLAPGRWTIRWRTVSADGHAVKGDIPFTVGTPAAR
jgi:copper resistance protein C